MERIVKETEGEVAGVDPRFALVVNAFAGDRQVTHGGSKGFGSGALKVKGKIFAMMSSKAKFVVKLPKERVDELVSSGKGERFDPGHGRLMREWVVIVAGRADRVELAKEAYNFVKRGGP
ncbi:MAG: hypothetical protein ACRD1O_05750 [Terriglobia bacterium]